MKSDWFTSDTHFGHRGIIEFCKRPFANVDEMTEGLIERWNAVVGPNDDVWHHGDFAFGRDSQDPDHYILRLNGRIHILWGNHDEKRTRKAVGLFASAQEVRYLRLNGERIFMSHYPHRAWPNSHRGSWHTYGHVHGSLPNFHRSMDVGVDSHAYRPVHFDELKAYMDKQDVTLHHPELLTDPWDKATNDG